MGAHAFATFGCASSYSGMFMDNAGLVCILLMTINSERHTIFIYSRDAYRIIRKLQTTALVMEPVHLSQLVGAVAVLTFVKVPLSIRTSIGTCPWNFYSSGNLPLTNSKNLSLSVNIFCASDLFTSRSSYSAIFFMRKILKMRFVFVSNSSEFLIDLNKTAASLWFSPVWPSPKKQTQTAPEAGLQQGLGRCFSSRGKRH